MNMIQAKIINRVNNKVIRNISSNIEKNLKLLNIKLPELANLADVDYFTLRKIINHTNGYLPNIRILTKLALFFKIKTGDLLNYDSLPQYIPIIDLDKAEVFLNNEISEFELQDKIFCDYYIHDNAFSIKHSIKSFNLQLLSDYICYPIDSFYKDGIYLVKQYNQVCLIQVHTIKDKKIYFTNSKSDQIQSEDIDDVFPLAVVIKIMLNQNIYKNKTP